MKISFESYYGRRATITFEIEGAKINEDVSEHVSKGIYKVPDSIINQLKDVLFECISFNGEENIDLIKSLVNERLEIDQYDDLIESISGKHSQQ